MSYFENIDIQSADSASIDAFGRWRVSQQTTLIDLKHIFDKQPLLVDEELVGTATATHDAGESSVTLAAPANGDAAIMQTFQRTHYQSGKSQQIFMTFYDLGEGTNISVNIARNGTKTSITRNSWDDPLDGTGDSGITHDFDDNTIFMVDFEWLGVGRVRFFIVRDGVLIKFHELDFTDTTLVYMESPNQPLRWECRQTGAGQYRARAGYFTSNQVTPFNSTQDGIWLESDDNNGTFTYICAAVNSEGATNLIGKPFSIDAGTNDIQLNSTGVDYAAGAIRLKSTHSQASIKLISFDYLAETNDRARWQVVLNPTVTGTFAFTGVTDSAVEGAIGNQTGGAAPTVTGGTVLQAGYVQQQDSVIVEFDSAIDLGTAIDGTVDELVIVITPINAGLDAFVSINWKELV